MVLLFRLISFLSLIHILIAESNYVTQINISFYPSDSVEIFPYDIVDLSSVFIDRGLNCIKCIIRFVSYKNVCLLKLNASDKNNNKKYSTKKSFQILEN